MQRVDPLIENVGPLIHSHRIATNVRVRVSRLTDVSFLLGPSLLPTGDP